MILCEKCTHSTVARNLTNSVVLDDLAFNFCEVVRVLKDNIEAFDDPKAAVMKL